MGMTQKSKMKGLIYSTKQQNLVASLVKGKRGRKRRTKIFRMPRSPGFLTPDKMMVDMRYSYSFRLDPPTGGVSAVRSFFANGIFKPDALASGGDTHQPFGRDQWAVFYNKYVVKGSKISATVLSNATTPGTGNVAIGIVLGRDIQVPSITDGLERTAKKPRFITYGNANAEGVKLGSRYSAKKFWGLKDAEDDDGQRVLMSANPATGNLAYYNVWGAGTFASGDPVTLDIIVTIDYAVLLSNPKTPVQS